MNYETNDVQSWIEPPTNYVGTSLFLGYIVAALALTITILFRDILPRWPNRKPVSNTSIPLLSTLALLSFSLLSYNMILFLVESFLRYLEMVGRDCSAQELWPWMLHSSLFTTFARSLLVYQGVAAWSRQALFVTMTEGAGMSFLGRRHKVNNLWVYFCLGQILPPSFAYFMLQLRIALSKNGSPAQANDGATKGKQQTTPGSIWLSVTVLSVSAYSVMTLKPTSAEETDWQVLARVLWLRLLLFVPLFVDTTSLFKIKHVRFLLVEQSAPFSLVLLASHFAWHDYDTTWSFIHAGFSNAAIQTLSSDLVIKHAGDVLLRIAVSPTC